jgi:nitrilase
MRVVKAAAVQLSPVLYSREGTAEKLVRKIRQLGEQGVQFATFPETVIPITRTFCSSSLPSTSSPDMST